jgi:hypothetical protein
VGRWVLGFLALRLGEGEKRARPAVSVETVTFRRQGGAFQGPHAVAVLSLGTGWVCGPFSRQSQTAVTGPLYSTANRPTRVPSQQTCGGDGVTTEAGSAAPSLPPRGASLSLPCSSAQARRRIVLRHCPLSLPCSSVPGWRRNVRRHCSLSNLHALPRHAARTPPRPRGTSDGRAIHNQIQQDC